MSDPVEAVARALFDAYSAEEFDNWQPWDESNHLLLKDQFRRLARAALAALPGEPVAWQARRKYSDGNTSWFHIYDQERNGFAKNKDYEIRPLYASPPLPSREAIAGILHRFHQSACYPNADVEEVNAYVQAILDILGAPRT